jgi:ATP-dependent helicase Lhr and Lhr-like helicase
VLVPLQGLALPADVWERDVLPARVGAYSPTWIDELSSSGEVVWVGAGALGRGSGRVAVYFRADAAAIGPPPNKLGPPEDPAHIAVRERLATAPCFFTDLLAELAQSPEEIQEALWDLVWAGEATNDAWAPLRAPRLTVARAARLQTARPGRRFGARRSAASGLAHPPGRWSLTASLFAAAPADASARRRTVAELLLERHGIVTREHVLAEGVPGGFSALYDAFAALETLGVCRRGYFVEGLGGAQFALPGAVERLRAQGEGDRAPAIVLAATDPGQPYGAALPWPKRDDDAGETRRPQRVAGAQVVLEGGEPVLYVERGGRGIAVLVDHADPRVTSALRELADFVMADRSRRISLERVNGQPVVGSPWEDRLIDLGFRAGPRKLTLSA